MLKANILINDTCIRYYIRVW